ncbi:Protein argonaute 10 [Actinomortierella ambigua]|nr:Protein argonaute 10 [Actinomortierella ambigua]
MANPPTVLTENSLRPDQGGTLGRPLTINTNFFAVSRLPTKAIYHYDTRFSIDLPPKRARQLWKKVEASDEMQGARAVFDGKFNVFAASRLPFGNSATIQVDDKGDKVHKDSRDPLSIKLTHVNTIDLSDLHAFLGRKGPLTPDCMQALQAMNVALVHETMCKFVNRGSSIFFENQTHDITGGVQVWKGLFQALKLGSDRIYANIDVAASTFLKGGNAAEIMLSNLPRDSRDRIDPRDHAKIERLLRYKVAKISACGAHEIRFDHDGRSVSVQEYFTKEYHLRLRYPQLPCLGVCTKNDQIAYFPAELCLIEPGQKYTKKLDEKQTAAMIKATCQKPADRLIVIQKGLRDLDVCRNEHVRDFGLEIDQGVASVRARILPAPEVCFKNESSTPENGTWRLGPAYHGATLRHWGVLCFDSERQFSHHHMQTFIRELVCSLGNNGVSIANSAPMYRYINPQASVAMAIDGFWVEIGRATRSDPQIIIVILPRRCSMYTAVKTHCESGEGIGKMTQCVVVDTLRGARKSYYGMLSLKINAKLGGTNWTVSPRAIPFLTGRPAMLIGVDVSHPSVGDTTQPSIVAVVASVNPEASRYIGRVKAQAGRTEVIVNFKYLVYNLIKTFKDTSGHHPQRILMYRDGVSDGEFGNVLREEMVAIKEACMHINPTYQPPVTLVVVKKRHHARFFPKQPHESDRRSGNCLSGTVVDSAITHPTEFDFYLQSHAGLIGTSRPALYHVLWDENRFTSDEIQQLTYNLCFLYARCPRAVSIVPPVYYAHLLAFRARHYLGFSDTAPLNSLPDIILKKSVENKMFFV